MNEAEQLVSAWRPDSRSRSHQHVTLEWPRGRLARAVWPRLVRRTGAWLRLGLLLLAVLPAPSHALPAGCWPLGSATCSGPVIDLWSYANEPLFRPVAKSSEEEAFQDAMLEFVRAHGGCPSTPRSYPPFAWNTSPHAGCGGWGGTFPTYGGAGYFGIESGNTVQVLVDTFDGASACQYPQVGGICILRSRSVHCPDGYLVVGDQTSGSWCVKTSNSLEPDKNRAPAPGTRAGSGACGGAGGGFSPAGGGRYHVGNPCDPASGNKYQIESDYRGPAPAAPEFTRTYNSNWINGGRFAAGYVGTKWLHSYERAVRVVESTAITNAYVLRPGGNVYRFTFYNGEYYAEADIEDRLIATGGGWVYQLRDGSTETYDAGGRLLAITDAHGLSQTLAYDAQGRLTAVTGNFGHTLLFGYDPAGRIGTLTDPAGQVTSYSYDTRSNLAQVSYPDGSSRIYHYENPAFPNHLTGITDGNGTRHATYGYDAGGRAALTEHAGGVRRYTLNYGPISTVVTDAAGTPETYNYAVTLGVRNLTSRVNVLDGKSLAQTFDSRNNLTSRTDETGRTTTYTYNGANQRVRMTEAAGTAQARTTNYQYLAPTLSLPTVIEAPSIASGKVRTTAISYDVLNNPTAIIQSGFTPAGVAVSRTVAMSYNAYGQVSSIDGPRTDVADVTTFDYYLCAAGGACGQLKSVTNALGHVTTYDAYDAHGRVLQTTEPNGTRTGYAYDLRGRMTSLTRTAADGTARATTYAYDAAGQLVQTSLPGGQQLTYSYDAAHLLRSVTDNYGNRIEYDYDLRGNRIRQLTRDPGGNLVRSVETEYDLRSRASSINNGGSVTQLVHDAIGNLLARTDPRGGANSHDYDPLNRLIRTVDALGGTTGYRHDALDRAIEVAAPNGATTGYEYDDLGNLLRETSPDRGTTNYAHDAAGNLASQTDARGVTASYRYDALNRPVAVSYAGGSTLAAMLAPLRNRISGLIGVQASGEDLGFTYDTCPNGRGRLCAVQDEAGGSSYAYDGFGNVTSHLRTELGINYTTGYAYDAADRVITVAYPDGRVVNYTRDALGRIQSVSALVGGAITPIVNNRLHRADGRISSQFFGNGLAETRTHDLQGRLTEQVIGAEIRRYGYDPNGNIVMRQSPVQGDAETYDALDRLATEARSGAWAASDAYGYDPNGNRTVHNTQTLSYTPGSNRLVQTDGLLYTLDAAGNTLADPQGRAFDYNLAGRLASVTVGSRPKDTIAYSYNAQGLRTRKAVHTNTTVYHYDQQGRLIAETDERGKAQAAYIWDDAGPIAQITRPNPNKETVVFLHSDHLDTPRSASDVLGKTVWRWEGDAFGDTLPNEDPDGDKKDTIVNLRFPGQYYDAETGLHYNWNRYYDPGIGRYVTSDPAGIVSGINTYSYALNNSLRWSDLTGLDATNWSNTANGRSIWDGPTNGNWGGRCWSGGAYSCGGNPPGDAPPTDSGDQCYQRHDNCYIECANSTDLQRCAAACNRTLVDELDALPDNPSAWTNPPRPGTEGDSRRYRNWARRYFASDH